MIKFVVKIIVAVLLLAIMAAAGAVYWATHPVLAQGKDPVVVEVLPGSSVQAAARSMQEAGLDMNVSLFRALVRLSGRDIRIHAGSYLVTPGMTPFSLLDKLVSGDVIKDTLTIIEGWTFRQMRTAIDAHPGLRHDTAGMSEREILARVAPEYTHPEGLFMPETFLFARGSSDLQIYRQAYALMKTALDAQWQKRDPALPYTSPYEALIMASIVEKESGHRPERGQIAGVFINRLRIGMRLQTDPTVIYGMGEQFDGNIRKKDLLTDTNYNTYTRHGLPPTPIALPGRESLQAAFHPATTNALYFVARGDGTSYFSSSLGEHNNAVNTFIRKGRAPVPAPAVEVTPQQQVKPAPVKKKQQTAKETKATKPKQAQQGKKTPAAQQK